jgi:MFS family permease
MLGVLGHYTYRQLFAAQIVSLTGTGLATVALGLLAFDLAGERAGAVLGTALAIKMVAYIVLSPLAAGLVAMVPRRTLLITADLIRVAIAALLPFVTEVWQIYVLIFLLQSASAIFTPVFQATIPDVLPKESDYTRALSLARLAYDLESLASPLLAAALLTVVGFHWLFAGTSLGFLVSAGFVLSVSLPRPAPRDDARGHAFGAAREGVRIYLKTPRLRGLFALNLSAAAAGAMVIVNSVVIVRAGLSRPDGDVALLLAAFGLGSMAAALALPKLLDYLPDRPVMLAGAALMTVLMVAGAGLMAWGGSGIWPGLLALWCGAGLGYSAVLTPSGRLLRKSSGEQNRTGVYAAQFALSHAAWLVCYPLAGWLGRYVGLEATFLTLAILSLIGLAGAARAWPADDPEVLAHDHDGLPDDHPHLQAHPAAGKRHEHDYVIDDLHPDWPRRAG